MVFLVYNEICGFQLFPLTLYVVNVCLKFRRMHGLCYTITDMHLDVIVAKTLDAYHGSDQKFKYTYL